MITREQFEYYKQFRQLGCSVKQFGYSAVSTLTGLSKNEIIEIISNYWELNAKYYPKDK